MGGVGIDGLLVGGGEERCGNRLSCFFFLWWIAGIIP